MSQSNSNRRVVFAALLLMRPKRSWRPVALALLISIFLEIVTWKLKVTADASLPMAIANGSLIWLSLSLLLWLSESLSYHLFYRWLKIGLAQSLNASTWLDRLVFIFSGLVLVNILHLTGTTTSASGFWYFVIGMLHCIHAGQLRRNIK